MCSVTQSWTAVKKCLKECTCPDDYHFTGICFSQGFVEFDYCKAHCLMSTFDFKLSCATMDKGLCKRVCKSADCEDHCPKPEKTVGICASNGYLYSSECSMKCRNEELKIVSKCKTPFSFKDCAYSCAKARNARLGHHRPHQPGPHHPGPPKHRDCHKCQHKKKCKKCHKPKCCKPKHHFPMVGTSYL